MVLTENPPDQSGSLIDCYDNAEGAEVLTKSEAHSHFIRSRIDFLRSAVLAPNGGKERFHAMFFDLAGLFARDERFGVGEQSKLHLPLRSLFTSALAHGARGMIVAHNHPSGDCRPSSRDETATARIAQIANALGIELIDHLIVTPRAVFSMRAGECL